MGRCTRATRSRRASRDAILETCKVQACNEWGDPCPGIQKHLLIEVFEHDVAAEDRELQPLRLDAEAFKTEWQIEIDRPRVTRWL